MSLSRHARFSHSYVRSTHSTMQTQPMKRLAPIFVRSAPQSNLLIPPTHKAQEEGKKPLYGGPARHIGRLVRHLGRLRHSHTRRQTSVAWRVRPYSPLSLSYVACPLMSQNHISSYEPRKTPAFPCKCERPPWALDSQAQRAIQRGYHSAPHFQPFSTPSFSCILMRGHHVHFVDTPPPPHVRRTSACSPRPRILLAGPIGRPIGRPAPCA